MKTGLHSRSCANCASHFPPLNSQLDGRYVFCALWDTTKRASYLCKAWGDEANHYFIGAPPYWCHSDRSRKTTEEIAACMTPQAVISRLRELEDNGEFKRRAAAHIRRNGNIRPRPTDLSPSSPTHVNINNPVWKQHLQGTMTEDDAALILDALPPYVH